MVAQYPVFKFYATLEDKRNLDVKAFKDAVFDIVKRLEE